MNLGKNTKKKTKKKKNSLHKNKILNEKALRLIRNSSQLAYEKGVKMSGGILNGSVELPLLEDRELYEHQVEKLDSYFEEFHQQERVSPSCGKGCSYCCSYPIFINDLEYISIKEWIEENFNEDKTRKLNENLSKWKESTGDLAEQLQQGHEKILNIEPGVTKPHMVLDTENKNEELRKEYTAKKIDCPFLEENNCSIYEIRPVSCRSYFAYGNSSRCEKSLYPVGTINYNCAERNIYVAPLLNTIRKLSNNNPLTMRSYEKKIVKSSKLMPLRFLEYYDLV